MSRYVYAVVRAEDGTPDAKGIGDPPARLSRIEGDGVAAVVSDLPDGFELHEQDAVRHLEVLNDLAAEQAVLPLRFGTIAPDDASVRTEVLSSAGLRESLEAIGPFVELRVGFAFGEDATLREVLADDPGLRGGAQASSMEARIELGQAVAQRVEHHVQQRGRQLVDDLLPLAEASVRLSSGNANEDRWALLVDRSRVPAVDDAVRDLGHRAPEAEITYIGPMPTFSFLDLAHDQEEQYQSRWGW